VILFNYPTIFDRLLLPHFIYTEPVNANTKSFVFLGFNLKRRNGKLMITPTKKAIEKFKETVRTMTHRGQPVKPWELIGRLNSVIRGWGNYFRIGNVKRLFERLDCWIRTRVRTFIERKKSRYARMRIPKHVLESGYKLVSLMTLIKPHSL